MATSSQTPNVINFNLTLKLGKLLNNAKWPNCPQCPVGFFVGKNIIYFLKSSYINGL